MRIIIDVFGDGVCEGGDGGGVDRLPGREGEESACEALGVGVGVWSGACTCTSHHVAMIDLLLLALNELAASLRDSAVLGTHWNALGRRTTPQARCTSNAPRARLGALRPCLRGAF